MRTVKIYTLSNPIDGTIRYVGKTETTLEKRLKGHIYDLKRCNNKHKLNWFNLLLTENKKPLITLLDEVPYKEWVFWECFWIDLLTQWGFNLVNGTKGGEGYTSDQVKKLWLNDEYRKHHTDRVQGVNHPMYGRHHSEKTKKILSEKCGRKGTSHPMYGFKYSDEEKKKRRLSQPNIKTCVRMDMDGHVIDRWDGVNLMCRELNLDASAVLRVVKGIAKQHKGYKFKYE
jgi:group I intron endonuclease